MPKSKVRNCNLMHSKSQATAARALAARLRELRQQRQISQGDIEKRTGLLRCYVSRVEGGYTVPSIETLEKFAAALAVPLHALFQQGKASEVSAAARPIAAKAPSADPFFDKLRRCTARMDEHDRDLFLSMVRKLAVMAA